MQQRNFNLTSWDKPWIPELDWLNSYINLSTYEDIYLEGLAVGYRITKYAKYFFGTNFGCYLMFPYDADLADGYYMEYYNNTNKSMPLCTPIIPMRLDTFRKWVRTNSLLQCRYYQVGWLKEIYQQGDLHAATPIPSIRYLLWATNKSMPHCIFSSTCVIISKNVIDRT